MSVSTKIAWTDATWNPWQGCRKVSQGCKNCYMYAEKTRYGQDPATVVRSKDATFYAPFKWEKQAVKAGEQRKVFTCSWSDFFIEEADTWRDEALAIIAMTPHLTYQILTKRPERMLDYFTRFSCNTGEVWKNYLSDVAYKHFGENAECAVANAIDGCLHPGYNVGWPMRNLWIGTSIENQAAADTRIPVLLQCPATVRFLSAEPLLEAIHLDPFLGLLPEDSEGAPYPGRGDWVILGGESGSGARPCQLSWIQTIVDQCRDTKTACFVKQLGTHAYDSHEIYDLSFNTRLPCPACPSCRYRTNDRKGSDPAEWPPSLRVQEFPQEGL